MTASRRDTLNLFSKQATLILTLINLLSVLAFGGWYVRGVESRFQAVDVRFDNNEREDATHHNSTTVHMPLREKIQYFVTRDEYDRYVAQRDREFANLKAQMLESSTRIHLDMEELDDKVDLLLKNGRD